MPNTARRQTDEVELALEVFLVRPTEMALNFNPKSTPGGNGSSVLFWANDEHPVIIARIKQSDILEVDGKAAQRWQKWLMQM